MPARLILIMLLATTATGEQFAMIGTYGGRFASIPVDARGEAMGLATTVNPLGPTAFWWNPAPLPEPDRVMISYTIWDYPLDEIRWRPVAIRASRGNLTFGYLWGRLSMDPVLVRTAYEPEGDGTTIDASKNLHQFSLAADLVPWLTAGSSRWRWTVGANARLYHERLAEATASTWDADLGTSLAWELTDSEVGDVRLHGTAMVRNLFRGTHIFDEAPVDLPRYYHFGLGVEVGLGSVWRGQRVVIGTVSHTWRRDLEDLQYDYGSEHLGFECLVGGMLALRAGHRTRSGFVYDSWSWGGGLQYRFDLWQGIRAAVDYARIDADNAVLDRSQDHWTFTAGFDLP